MILTVSVVMILCAGEFVRSSIGFGNALVAMPLLLLVLDWRVATPLFALVTIVNSVMILGTNWHSVRLGDSLRLNLGAIAGIPAGLWLLNNVPQRVGVTVLAVMIISYAAYNLWGPAIPHLTARWPAVLLGAVAGLTNAAFNVAGPPVVVYGTLRRWPPPAFRATLQSFFVPTSVVVVAGHGLSGLWTMEVLRLVVVSLPAVLLTMVAGGWVNRHLPPRDFSRLINGFLLIAGVVMLAGR